MIKIIIQKIEFKPCFPCSISIVAKIQNKQFKILDQMSLKSINLEQEQLFPIKTTINIENTQKLSQKNSNLSLCMNLMLITSTGKIKLASIKKNIRQISANLKLQQQKIANSTDKNAKIIYSIVYQNPIYNSLKQQNQNKNIQSEYKRITSANIEDLNKQKNHRQNTFNIKNNNFRLKVGENDPQKLRYINLSKKKSNSKFKLMKSLQFNRNDSNQSEKTNPIPNTKTVYNQYQQKYHQIKKKLQNTEKKYNVLVEKQNQLRSKISNILKENNQLNETNKKLLKQIQLQENFAKNQKKQSKRLKNMLNQSQRVFQSQLQSEFAQNKKLRYRQELLKDKLKNVNEKNFEMQQENQNLQKQIQKLLKKNSELQEIRIKKQEQYRILKQQIVIENQKCISIQVQKFKLRQKVDILTQKNNQLKNELNKICQKQVKNEQKIKDIQDKLLKEKSNNQEINLNLQQKNKIIIQLEIINKNLKEEQNKIKKLNDDLQAQMKLLKAKIKQKCEEKQILQVERDNLQQQLKQQKIVRQNLTAKIKKMDRQNLTQSNRYNMQKEQTNQQRKNYEQKILTLTQQILSKNKQIQTLKQEIQKINFNKQTLKEQILMQSNNNNSITDKIPEIIITKVDSVIEEGTKNEQLQQKYKKIVKSSKQLKNLIQDKQLVIASFKSNNLKALNFLQSISKNLNTIQKNHNGSSVLFQNSKQKLKKLEALLSKVPKGVQKQQEEFPMIKLSKPKSSKQTEMNKSQLLLNPKRQKQLIDLNRSQLLQNQSRNLDNSFRSCVQSSFVNSRNESSECKQVQQSILENVLME